MIQLTKGGLRKFILCPRSKAACLFHSWSYQAMLVSKSSTCWNIRKNVQCVSFQSLTIYLLPRPSKCTQADPLSTSYSQKGSLKQRANTTKHTVNHCIYIGPFSPKQCGHTEGVLTVGVKGPVFVPGGIIRVRPIPCKFPHKMALVKCPCAFRLRRLAQNGRGRSIRHSPCKFPRKMVLVKCPCAFRLRRLAQDEASHTEILPRDLL